MKKLKKFFVLDKPAWHRWWLWMLLFVFLISVPAVPMIINFLYMTGVSDGTVNTAFTASDLLSFWGSFLSFLGTVVLGIIAVWQTQKLHKINQQLEENARKQQEERERIAREVKLNVKLQVSATNTKFAIENISDNNAHHLQVSDIMAKYSKTGKEEVLQTYKFLSKTSSHILGKSSCYVEFQGGAFEGEFHKGYNTEMWFHIDVENIYKERKHFIVTMVGSNFQDLTITTV